MCMMISPTLTLTAVRGRDATRVNLNSWILRNSRRENGVGASLPVRTDPLSIELWLVVRTP
eukprot:COSAG02_NODE_1832_length_10723_cov_13.708020_4_plen_61_part_00